MIEKRLIESSIIYTFGNIFTQGLGFLAIIIYVRYMDVVDFGRFSIYAAWLSILSSFVSYQLHDTFAIAKSKYRNDFDSYVSTSILISIFLTLVFLCIFLLFQKIIIATSQFDFLTLILMIVTAFCYGVNNMNYQYYIQKQESIKQLLVLSAITICTVVLSIFLLFTIHDDFMARVYGVIVPTFIFSTFFIKYIWKRKFSISIKKYYRFILLTSTPLVFHSFAQQLLIQLDRIMLGNIVNLEAAAIYSFNYSIALILQVVVAGITTAWTPWWLEKQKEGDIRMILSYQNKIFLLVFFLSVGYLSVAPEILYLIGKNFYNQDYLMTVLIVLAYYFKFLCTFPTNVELLNENTFYIFVGTAFAAIVNFVLNSYFIPKHGLIAAPFTTLASCVALFIFHYFISLLVYRYHDIKFKTYFLFIVFMIIYSFFSYYFQDNTLMRWGVCFLLFLILGYFYRKDIQTMLKYKGGERGRK